MAQRILFSLCLLLIFTRLQAVEIQQGQQYAAGTLLESSAAGVALEVPAGWIAAWPQNSGMLVLGRTDNQGSIFVYVDQFDAATARQTMSQPVPLGDGFTLTPKSAPTEAGDATLSADYAVVGGTQELFGRIATRVGGHGIGASFIAVATGGARSSVFDTAAALAKSIRFKQPVANQAASDAGTGPWQDYMRGRYVVRYYTASGYTEEEHIWLCSDGSFFRQSASGGFGGGASGAFAGKGHGSWRARGSTSGIGELVLQYGAGSASETDTTFGSWSEQNAGGEQLSYSLELRDGSLYLNQRQWFRDSNQRCQ